MSKSKGNVVDPWLMIEKYGADAVRWYFYTINQPGDPKRFDEAGLKESSAIFMTLFNCLNFYKMFAGEEKIKNFKTAENVLDKWIISKLNSLNTEVSKNLDEYDVVSAGRKIAEFVTDLSTWYIRRSRARFKNEEEKKLALPVLKFVILETAKIMAPFTPFVADSIYKEVGGEKESVHLEDWSETEKVDEQLINEMVTARDITELALSCRNEQAIKIRQPLAELKISTPHSIRKEILNVIADEINVKKISTSKELLVINKTADWIEPKRELMDKFAGKIKIYLSKIITPELKMEGYLREVVRQVNSLRKEAGFTISDRAILNFETENAEAAEVFEKFADEIKKGTLCDEINQSKTESDIEKELKIDGEIKVLVGIKKV